MQIPNLETMTGDFARDLARLTARQRHELVRLMGNPPDLRNVPDEFWREARREFQSEAAAALFLILLISMTEHGLDEGTATTEAARMANAQAGQVAGDFVTSAQQDLRASPAEGLTTVAERAFGPIRMAVIADVQSVWAQTQGGEIGVGMTVGLSPEDRWRANAGLSKRGPCQTCKTLDGQPRSYWERFFPKGPPTPHPGCVCEILYANMKGGAQ